MDGLVIRKGDLVLDKNAWDSSKIGGISDLQV